jgi:DNA-binding transcriptional LysR family regulator
LKDSGLTARRVGEVRRLWVASPDYLQRRGVPERPGDLIHHEAIQSGGPGSQEWTFGSRHRGASPRLAARFRVNDVETQLALTRDGRGIARLLSYQVADDLARGSLVGLLAAYEPPPLPVHLVTMGKTHRTAATEAFLELAVEMLTHLPVLRPAAS